MGIILWHVLLFWVSIISKCGLFRIDGHYLEFSPYVLSFLFWIIYPIPPFALTITPGDV